ncbi:hypothetical protein Ccrd_022703, partial [Cynara cardunculus var. scolymus]
MMEEIQARMEKMEGNLHIIRLDDGDSILCDVDLDPQLPEPTEKSETDINKLKSAAQKYRIPTLRSMAQELSLVLVPETIFTHEELRDYLSQIRVRAPHYIEIVCGCTSGKYGDSLGLLRISDDGTISAVCHLFDSPVEFVKHGSRTSNVPNWRKKVWILNQNGQKIKMIDTSFLKYYYGDNFRRPHNESGHRDQFLRCTACNKVRRFELRSREL